MIPGMIWYDMISNRDTVWYDIRGNRWSGSSCEQESAVGARHRKLKAYLALPILSRVSCLRAARSRRLQCRPSSQCGALGESIPHMHISAINSIQSICIYPLLIRSIQSTSQHLTGHRWPKCLLCAVCGPGQLPWLVVCAGQRGRTQNTPPWPEMWKVTRVQISIPNGHYIFVESGTTAPTFLGENYLELV